MKTKRPDRERERQVLPKTGSGDRIMIRDLLLRCVIGIFDEERKNKQDVLVNLTLEADLGAACRSDRIEDTIDYKALTKKIIAATESSSFFLVERLAQEIADICLTHSGVTRTTVAVEKPGALRFSRSVGVEIVREKNTRSFNRITGQKKKGDLRDNKSR